MKRAAIIGCGTIFQVHLPIIVANPEIELCAVCDNNPAVQEKLPAAAKAVPFYTDYEELLEKEHPDVVHLCLPHYLHVPVSEYFASHGVNVFCEKPVGLNTDQTFVCHGSFLLLSVFCGHGATGWPALLLAWMASISRMLISASLTWM